MNTEIGANPLPRDVQEKLGEFLDWFDGHYETSEGTTALYWYLSYEIAARIKNEILYRSQKRQQRHSRSF